MKSVYQSSLFSEDGRRKYICGSELPRFLDAARAAGPKWYAFCRLLAYTGCRLSEALALTPGQLDCETGRVVFRTLKRRRPAFRAVPIPPDLMAELKALGAERGAHQRLWPCCRQTAWRRVKAIMAASDIAGPQAMPKGLRHGFGCANAERNIPMATTQKWLGHASLETTAIYQQAVGSEERAFAQRLWQQWRQTVD